jgi:hypothetical protein
MNKNLILSDNAKAQVGSIEDESQTINRTYIELLKREIWLDSWKAIEAKPRLLSLCGDLRSTLFALKHEKKHPRDFRF